MKANALAFAATVLVSILTVTGGRTADTKQKVVPETVAIAFGQAGNGHVVSPAMLELERGPPYLLLISNPSNETHFVVPTGFSGAIQTQRLDVRGGSFRSVSSLHGREPYAMGAPVGMVEVIELGPGGVVSWQFVAMEPGTYSLECGISSHAARGMKATIVIDQEPPFVSPATN